ncbi:hypothetical protein D3C72_2361440 [compost metagenome]
MVFTSVMRPLRTQSITCPTGVMKVSMNSPSSSCASPCVRSRARKMSMNSVEYEITGWMRVR